MSNSGPAGHELAINVGERGRGFAEAGDAEPPATYTSFQTITVDPLGLVIHQSESRAQMRSATPLDDRAR
jgi:hypothetical protein